MGREGRAAREKFNGESDDVSINHWTARALSGFLRRIFDTLDDA
jgi:hypothetical protein